VIGRLVLNIGVRPYLIQRHAFMCQFYFCFFVLGQVRQTHVAQHIGRLRELDIVVADHLYSVAPRIAKVKEGTIKSSPASLEINIGFRPLSFTTEAVPTSRSTGAAGSGG